jgi:hypothetical protein
MLGRFVCGFLSARADCRDLELRKRAQGRNVGIAPPQPLRILAPMMPTRIHSFCRHDVSSLQAKLVQSSRPIVASRHRGFCK